VYFEVRIAALTHAYTYSRAHTNAHTNTLCVEERCVEWNTYTSTHVLVRTHTYAHNRTRAHTHFVVKRRAGCGAPTQYTRASTRTYIRTQSHTHTHVHIHTHTLFSEERSGLWSTYTLTHTRSHTHTLTHSHTHTHTLTHSHSHTLTHA